MATKLDRKRFPSGLCPGDFTYQGRPAKDQDDFGSDVGITDMVCINQFGEANNAKYYHAGVVKASDGTWWCYFEWGRMKAARSWNGTFGGGDYQFLQCSSEDEARREFQKKCRSKNIARLVRGTVEGIELWTAKKGKDGYLVQSLATREKGLPDAYKIKDDSGVGGAKAAARAKASKSADKRTPRKARAKSAKNYQPQVVSLAQDLVGGVRNYTRAMAQASGVTPTMDAIEKVRNDLIPAALKRIAAVGNDVERQIKDGALKNISRMVNSLVPRPIPRTGWTDEEAILSADNILSIQADLDAFESSLLNEDFSIEDTVETQVNPDELLNAQLRWIDPNSTEGRWLWGTFVKMTRNRHSYIRQAPTVRNLFAVERPDRDAKFMNAVKKVGAIRRGSFRLRANLQFPRQDLGNGLSDDYAQANVIMAIHGTRPVNIAPILGTNFRLPKSLPGAQITGANFGHGIYFATDLKKSYGYTGRGYWGHSGGDIKRRGCFMFLSDMLMGDAYRAPSTGSWNTPPQGKDSVFGVGGDRGHRLENDEHVIFDPHYQRIRYLVEFNWLT